MIGDSQRRLRLLSLDGGGVRGLSSIMILKEIMKGVNANRPREDRLHPWQFFDLIGGTGTGGLIAVMLGRLRMTIADCEAAYLELSERIFTPKRPQFRVLGRANDFLNANGKFDIGELEAAIKKIIENRQLPEAALMQDPDPGCKVSVQLLLLPKYN
jgi:patatin-like phospholipase/acyl hydrolase